MRSPSIILFEAAQDCPPIPPVSALLVERSSNGNGLAPVRWGAEQPAEWGCPIDRADAAAAGRGLTPLIWLHVLPYGEVKLNMRTRLALGKSFPQT